MDLLSLKYMKSIGRKRLLAKLVFLCLLTFYSGTSFSADNNELVPLSSILKSPVNTFEYEIEGRPDPFVPFITEKAAAAKIDLVDMNEIIDKTDQLTGMQLFEPGQLNLVALLKSGIKDIAMVEDFTGKGYILTEGTLIGKRGVVKDIAPNVVVIEETAVTRAGKKIISEIKMVLKKEGEEKRLLLLEQVRKSSVKLRWYSRKREKNRKCING